MILVEFRLLISNIDPKEVNSVATRENKETVRNFVRGHFGKVLKVFDIENQKKLPKPYQNVPLGSYVTDTNHVPRVIPDSEYSFSF